MSGGFNAATYVMFDSIIWKAMSGQVNRWRKKDLGLPPTDQSHLETAAVPFVYNFSSSGKLAFNSDDHERPRLTLIHPVLQWYPTRRIGRTTCPSDLARIVMRPPSLTFFNSPSIQLHLRLLVPRGQRYVAPCTASGILSRS